MYLCRPRVGAAIVVPGTHDVVAPASALRRNTIRPWHMLWKIAYSGRSLLRILLGH